MNNKSMVLDITGWLFGILVFAIGIVNTFWGNDAGFGVFIMLLSFVFFPPVTTLVKQKIGITIPRIAKIGLGVLIIWAAVGVGELFNKIELMMGGF
jgi:hypothetical protein